MKYALRFAMAAIALFGPLTLLSDTRKTCQDNSLAAKNKCYDDAWTAYQGDLAAAQRHYDSCMDPTPTPGPNLGGCYYDALERCGSNDTCFAQGRKDCDSEFGGESGQCRTSQKAANAAAETNLGTARGVCVTTYTNTNLACPPAGQCDKEADCIPGFDVGTFCVNNQCAGSLSCPVWASQAQCNGTQVCAAHCNDGTTCRTTCSNTCGGVCLDCFQCSPGLTFSGCSMSNPICSGTPIVLDPFDEGFHLTDIQGGVRFRSVPNGPLNQMSWTDPAWKNGWLVLDRNGNGMIDDMTELFGNMTPQPTSKDPNGFLALAVFDEPVSGGNGNGFIDQGDAVFRHLRVWIDANHNGVSEPNELHTLAELGVFKIDLHYHSSPFVDEYGNRFRYVGKIWDDDLRGRDLCYDVILQIQMSPVGM